MSGHIRPPDNDLHKLVDACRTTLLSCTNELVRVAAGVLDSNGQIFTAVQARSRNCNHCSVCAEAIAIGMALTAGSNDLAVCTSVVRSGDTAKVLSPCGSCRELLRDHEVGHVLVSDDHGRLTTISTIDLLPWP